MGHSGDLGDSPFQTGRGIHVADKQAEQVGQVIAVPVTAQIGFRDGEGAAEDRLPEEAAIVDADCRMQIVCVAEPRTAGCILKDDLAPLQSRQSSDQDPPCDVINQSEPRWRVRFGS